MRYLKGSPEYEINWEIFLEMDETIPMTRSERTHLRIWVVHGRDVGSNPWKYYELDGSDMNYLKAYRIRFGASHGAWDSWEYAPFLKKDLEGKLTILN
jgi:hypothetical protein